MRLGLVTFLVRDYDEAIAWFRTALDFDLAEDTTLSAQKRWVVVAPKAGGAQLLLAKAEGAQCEAIGRQAGGRVGFFIYVSALAPALARLRAANVTIEGAPRREAYGEVVVFRDLYGGRWDLIAPRLEKE
jgi:catechol 2,3-dioxygenase-like lactoylglutathione lyase family enzyme